MSVSLDPLLALINRILQLLEKKETELLEKIQVFYLDHKANIQK